MLSMPISVKITFIKSTSPVPKFFPIILLRFAFIGTDRHEIRSALRSQYRILESSWPPEGSQGLVQGEWGTPSVMQRTAAILAARRTFMTSSVLLRWDPSIWFHAHQQYGAAYNTVDEMVRARAENEGERVPALTVLRWNGFVTNGVVDPTLGNIKGRVDLTRPRV